MTTTHFAAGLGFAFVAACYAFGFGDAIVCLIGAAVFGAAAAFWHGELDLAELQDRISDRAPRARGSGSRGH